MPPQTRFSEIEIAIAHRDYLRGATLEAAAPRGASAATIRSLFICRGYPLVARRPGGPLRPQRIVVPDDPACLGYIAAMIDGEGYITRVEARERRVAKWRIGVTNTDKGLIDWLLATVPGTAFSVKRQRAIPKWPVRENRRDCYDWLVRGTRDVHALLLAVEPYLVVKGQRARRAIADIDEQFRLRCNVCDSRLLVEANQRIVALQGSQVCFERVEVDTA